MKIPVACASCGKRYEVDGAHAGKRAKCAACGERMIIPDDHQAAQPLVSEPDALSISTWLMAASNRASSRR